VIRHGLHFDQTRQVGIVLHMLATLAENGRVGATAVGNSPDEADRLLARLQTALEEEARRALQPRPLPEATVAAAGPAIGARIRAPRKRTGCTDRARSR
jgi:hypothetical protein